MQHRSTQLTVLILGLILGLSSMPALASNTRRQAAAQCCADGPRCRRSKAALSRSCLPGVWMRQQPRECQDMACNFCVKDGQLRPISFCRSGPIRRNCAVDADVDADADFDDERRRGCTFRNRGNVDHILIPVSQLDIGGGWVRNREEDSVTWRPNGGDGIVPPRTRETFCAVVSPSTAGRYYFTVTSRAPLITEHNDAWFRFSFDVDLYRAKTGSTRRLAANKWAKGYQNAGFNKWVDQILTIDFNGHQMSAELEARNRYRICVAGRSTKFTIRSLHLVRCSNGEICGRSSGNVRRALRDDTPSVCV